MFNKLEANIITSENNINKNKIINSLINDIDNDGDISDDITSDAVITIEQACIEFSKFDKMIDEELSKVQTSESTTTLQQYRVFPVLVEGGNPLLNRISKFKIDAAITHALLSLNIHMTTTWEMLEVLGQSGFHIRKSPDQIFNYKNRNMLHVYEYMLTTDEYIKLQKLEEFILANKDKLKYKISHLIYLVISKKYDKTTKRVAYNNISQDNTSDLDNINNMVCSVFVSWVLCKISDRFLNYLKLTGEDWLHIAPARLATIPLFRKLFSINPKTESYEIVLQKFLKNNPEYDVIQ